jgi:predicted transcriptional regulator
MPHGLREAARLCGGEPDTRRRPELEAEVHRLTGEGLSQKKIAAELGLSSGTVWRWLNPDAARRRDREAARNTLRARRALLRQERDEQVRKHGGNLAEAYSLVRRALQELDRAAEDEDLERDARQEINAALARLHAAEDRIAKAVRLR